MQRQVRNARDAGDGDYIARTLSRRMLEEPGNLDVRLELARHYMETGQPELAAEHYRLAGERFPDNVAIQVMLARTLRGMGLRQAAAEQLERFTSTRPQQSADALSMLGILRDELREYKAAEAAHRAALALVPVSDRLHNNLGYNLLLQGNKQGAAAEFRKALDLAPDSRVARNNLAMAMAADEQGTPEQLRTIANPAAAHNNVAAVLIEQGRYGEARKELEIALALQPDHDAALRNLRLVSELDGLGADTQARAGLWRRIASGVRAAIMGSEEPNTEAASTASK
jgi:Flp pilus assembly protein TadD